MMLFGINNLPRFLQYGQLCKNYFFKTIPTTTSLLTFLMLKEVRGFSQEEESWWWKKEGELKEVCILTPTPYLSSIPFSASLPPYPKKHKFPAVLAKCCKAGKFLTEH